MTPQPRLPLVTVVTPVFNGARFIRRTIESVLAQEGVSIEYIVVDGASTDNTLDIVREYKDRVSMVVSEPDNGMYDAINKGFSRSSGEVLCYLNSDDMYVPGALKAVATSFSRYSIDLCFGDCIYVDSEDRELFRYDGMALPYKWAARLGRIPFAQQTAFWSKGLFHEVGGFDTRYRLVADTKFLFECLRLAGHRRRYLHEYLAKFRLHVDAFSTKAAAEMRTEHDRVLEDLKIRPGVSRLAVDALLKWKNRWNILARMSRGSLRSRI